MTRKVSLTVILISFLLILVTSCATVAPSVSEFYVNGTLYAVMTETDFGNPGNPGSNSRTQVFDGWVLSGDSDVYTDWSVQPEGNTRFDAKYTTVEYVDYYVDGVLWLEQVKDDFADPGAPDSRYLPRGLEFNGWVASDSYDVNTDWTTAPSVGRFDALLTRNTTISAIGDVTEKINLKLDKSFDVLGPVSVEETYEIVDGRIKIGGKIYKDILDAAIALYPETDQVIDIVTEYKTVELGKDFVKNESGSALTSDRTFTDASIVERGTSLIFRTAVYTGLAININ